MTDWALYLSHPGYSTPGFCSPPWTIPVLWVMSKLPWWVILVMAVLTILAVSLKKLTPIGMLAFLICPFTVYGIGLMNIDWMMFLGMLAPPAVGCFLYSFKPHIGWVAMLKTKRYGLFILVSLLTICQWGAWFSSVGQQGRDISIFPFGLLFIPLVWQEPMAVGTLLSPHVSYGGWMFVAFAIAQKWPWILLAADVAMWATLIILRYL